MGGTSECEYREKLTKMSGKLSKREKDVREAFAKIEKMKVEASKKSEEMRRSVEHDLDKTERDITKSKDLAPESKETPLRDCRSKKGNQTRMYRAKNADL